MEREIEKVRNWRAHNNLELRLTFHRQGSNHLWPKQFNGYSSSSSPFLRPTQMPGEGAGSVDSAVQVAVRVGQVKLSAPNDYPWVRLAENC